MDPLEPQPKHNKTQTYDVGLINCRIDTERFEHVSSYYHCTSFIQELIKQGMEQKLEKSCYRCKKNTWHVESNYILQPLKYLIIVVNRFRYINNNFTKDWCSIPINRTVILGLHKFRPQAIINHHGPFMYSGHYTASINCCKEHSIATTVKLRSLKWLIPKTPLLPMWWFMNWSHNGFRTRTGGWEFWLLPWRWHILSIPLKAGRVISAKTCGLGDVFPPDDLGSGPCTPFIIYIPHIIAAFLLIKI